MAGRCSSWILPLLILFLAGISHQTRIADIDKPIPISVLNVVSGHTAHMECDLQSDRPEDRAYLVLWYIETQKQPIYSVDLRARPLDQAKHWRDDRLGNRARFDTTHVATLLLANVSDADSGLYRCRVDFRHSPTRHFRYQLNIVQLPKVPVIYDTTRRLNSIALPYEEGSDLTLVCEVAGGGPNVRVGWYQEDGKALESRAKYQNDNVYFYHLELHRLSRAEHGKTFWCRATLDVQPTIEPIQSKITLNIRLRPTSVEIVLPSTALESGRDQQVQCRTIGSNPAALVTWWSGNKQLAYAGNTQVVQTLNGTISTLTILPTMEDDGHILTCRAETPNLPGSAVEDSWRMQVYYSPRTSMELGRRVSAEEIREGSDIYLECHVRANPPIHRLVWIHNEKQLGDNREGGVFISNQSLVIRRIGRHTAGNYTCIATNRMGESASSPLYLHVKYAPVCHRSKPVTVVVARDQSASLRCQVDADPESVNFRWTLSTGRETALVPREVPSDTGLSSLLEYTPRRDADFGQLQCWAMNDIGKQKEPCIFNIVKEGLPATPSHCVMHSASNGILEVKCDGDAHDAGSPGGHELVTGGSSNVFWLQLYNPDTGLLLRNVSSKVGQFRMSGVDVSSRVAAVITAVNRQGRSESVTLEGAVERAVGSRAANEPESSMTMMAILAAPAALLVLIVALAGILALYQRQRKRTLRQREQTGNGLHPATAAASAAVTATGPAAATAASEPSQLQDDEDYPRPNSKQPDLIHPKRDHGSGHPMDGGNRQIREPQQTPSQGWSTSNQELGVSYKSMMEASPSDDHDDLTLFFPTVRTVATGGRISANSHHSQERQQPDVHDSLRNANFIYR